MSGGLFVTGTDTGVGKTLISAAIIIGLRATGQKVVAMKPVASGCSWTEGGLRSDDALRLLALCSAEVPYELVNPCAFEPPIAPHIAAAEAGCPIHIEQITNAFRHLARAAPWVVVEGVGGWAVPLDSRYTTAEMAAALALPVVLVVGIRLGCLNHALLTAAAIAQSRLPLRAWVANQIDPQCLRVKQIIHSLEKRLAAPCIGRVPYMDQPNPSQLSGLLDLSPILGKAR